MKVLFVTWIFIWLVLVDKSFADDDPAPIGPFKVKVINDLVKSVLTISKIALDIMSRNLEDRDGLKHYVKQVYGPLFKFIKEVMNEVE